MYSETKKNATFEKRSEFKSSHFLCVTRLTVMF